MTDPERALLGAVLAGYPDLRRLEAIVRAEDFANTLNAALWAELLILQRDRTLDPVTLKAHLDRTYGPGHAPAGVRWPTNDGPAYLLQLVDVETCPLPAAAPHYADAVHAAGIVRRLEEASRHIALTIEQGGEPDATVLSAKRALEAAVDDARRPDFHMGDALAAFVDDVETKHVPGPDTPWPDINRVLPTLDPGRFYVIGARPGVGKSLFGTNLAGHVADRRDRRVLLSSLEMSTNEVLARMLAAAAKVNLSKIISRDLTDDELGKIGQHFGDLDNGNLSIDDTPRQTVAHIQQRAVLHGADLVIVDYLQLVRPADTRLQRHEQISQITRELKIMARELKVCVVAMAQVNRAATSRVDGRPTLSDLRESGSIENDADAVLLLHAKPGVPEVTVDVAKNRNGPCGEATLLMYGHYARLESAAWKPSNALKEDR